MYIYGLIQLRRLSLMEQMEKQEIISDSTSTSSLPILPRVDRVDRLVQFLEERHDINWCNWEKHENNCEHYKRLPMSCAVEEVHYKGTLMDRLAILENRVLQLWVALDVEKNTTTSGFSSASASAFTLQSDHHDHHEVVNESTGVRREAINGNCRRQKSVNHFRKWLRYFPTGCHNISEGKAKLTSQ